MHEIEKKYDYSVLKPETTELLKVQATLIKTRTNQTIIENGESLSLSKKALEEEGKYFHVWVKEELGLRHERAYEYIRIFEKFGGLALNAKINLGKKTLELLSSNNVPDEARQEAMERSEAGEKITVKKTQEIKVKYQAQLAEKDAEIEKLKNPVPNRDNLIPELKEKYNNSTITPGLADRLSLLDEEDQELVDLNITAKITAQDFKKSADNAKLRAYEELNKAIKEKDAIQKQLDDIASTDTAQILLDKEQELKRIKEEYERKRFEDRKDAEKTASEIHEKRFKDQIQTAEQERDKAQRKQKEATEKASGAWRRYGEMSKEIDRLKEQLEVDNPTNVDNAMLKHVDGVGRSIAICLSELEQEISRSCSMEKSIERMSDILKKSMDKVTELQGSEYSIITVN